MGVERGITWGGSITDRGAGVDAGAGAGAGAAETALTTRTGSIFSTTGAATGVAPTRRARDSSIESARFAKIERT